MSRSFWPCNDNAVGHSVYVCLSVRMSQSCTAVT